MADKPKFGFRDLKNLAKKGIESIDVDTAKEKAKKAGELVGGKAMEIKDSAMDLKEDITDKLTELDRMLESSITEYNDAYTLMNDKGVQLFIERNRSVDTILIPFSNLYFFPHIIDVFVFFLFPSSECMNSFTADH